MSKEQLKKNEIDFTTEVLNEIDVQLNNETSEIVNFDKERETMKNRIENKIFRSIFGLLLKNIKVRLEVDYKDKTVFVYEFPKN